MAICGGCDSPIFDRYLYHVLDRPWHADCLQCVDCKARLAERCFSRDGLLLCMHDFERRFGTRCSGCTQSVHRTDMVRRVRDKVFHVSCFRCSVCQKRLDTGEELYILNGSRFVCKRDYASCRVQAGSDGGSDDDDELTVKTESDVSMLEFSSPKSGTGPAAITPSTTTSHNSETDANGGESQCPDENTAGVAGQTSGTKRRGPRTTIKAKQLDTLKSAFAATPKPTRHIREQLAHDTGLNMRVIQVWFQNRRSKERRMKQLRFGGFRPSKRNRTAIQGNDLVVVGGPNGSIFHTDGHPPMDSYFQPPIGFYCDMYTPEGPPPGFILDAGLQSRSEVPPPHGDYILEGTRGPQHISPTLPLTTSQEDTFHALHHGFHPGLELKSESSAPVGW